MYSVVGITLSTFQHVACTAVVVPSGHLIGLRMGSNDDAHDESIRAVKCQSFPATDRPAGGPRARPGSLAWCLNPAHAVNRNSVLF